MKYIIIGLGNYGSVLAEELSALHTLLSLYSSVSGLPRPLAGFAYWHFFI